MKGGNHTSWALPHMAASPQATCQQLQAEQAGDSPPLLELYAKPGVLEAPCCPVSAGGSCKDHELV